MEGRVVEFDNTIPCTCICNSKDGMSVWFALLQEPTSGYIEPHTSSPPSPSWRSSQEAYYVTYDSDYRQHESDTVRMRNVTTCT